MISGLPDISTLRSWDLRLLRTYKPHLSLPSKVCTLCALGPCSFKEGGKGRCGIKREGFLGRALLLQVVIGLSGHTSLARRVFRDLTERFGDFSIDMGKSGIRTPLCTLITGARPERAGEVEAIIDYIEEELAHLLSSIHYGGEGELLDFVSKALHAGMLDNLALEVGDVIQISALGMPRGESNSPLAGIGGKGRPLILVIGHNSHVGVEILRLLKERGLEGKIDVGGLCCAAHDLSRHHHGLRIIGNQADQIPIVASGIADLVILDTQCIRPDVVETAGRMGIPVIATAQETVLGLKDLTPLSPEEAAERLSLEGKGVIFHKGKAAEVSLIVASSFDSKKMEGERGILRIGRGPVRDGEIRGIAPSIVMGEIPGLVGLFGCPEEDPSDIQRLARELLSMGFVVATGGCSAIEIGKGSPLFQAHGDDFDAGNLVNLGSCLSASHFIGACIKIASVVSHRPIEGNYRGIADYILNRVGALLVLWGGFTQKALATLFGAMRLGIPVLLGPRGRGYGVRFEGEEVSLIRDARLDETLEVTTHPSSLLYVAHTLEEALYMIPRLTMRHNDTPSGRRKKLSLYAELFRKATSSLPPDLPSLVRSSFDIPEGLEGDLEGIRPVRIPDPTILEDHGGC